MTVREPKCVAEITEAYRSAAAEGPLKGFLKFTDAPIVSGDIVTDPSSCIFDSGLTKVIGDQVKVVGWYDNEWGTRNGWSTWSAWSRRSCRAMTRIPLIAGNWKMNLNHLEAIAMVQKLAFALPEKYYDRVEVAVLPPFTDIRSVQTLIDGDRYKMVHGAQDLSPYEAGAYTGDVSGAMLAKLGCRYVVIGHSSAVRCTARTTAW